MSAALDLARLRTLQELALRKTMAAVAEATHLSPSAISQQIAQLEGEAGLQLVERRGRGVRLTAAGERLCRHTERIVSILEEARTDLLEMRDQVGGEVRITSFPSVGAALLPPAIRAVQAAHPALQATVMELEPDAGMAALRAWHADVAIIDDLTLPADAGSGTMEILPLFVDHLFAVLPRDHRLGRQRHVTLQDLRHDPWAMDSSRQAYTQRIVGLCQAAGFSPRINAQCASIEVLVAMVESGCSVSVMPGVRLRLMKGRVVAKPLRPKVERAISIAFRKGERRNPALNAVVTELQMRAGHLAPEP